MPFQVKGPVHCYFCICAPLSSQLAVITADNRGSSRTTSPHPHHRRLFFLTSCYFLHFCCRLGFNYSSVLSGRALLRRAGGNHSVVIHVTSNKRRKGEVIESVALSRPEANEQKCVTCLSGCSSVHLSACFLCLSVSV